MGGGGGSLVLGEKVLKGLAVLQRPLSDMQLRKIRVKTFNQGL